MNSSVPEHNLKSHTYDRDQVVKIINSVLSKMDNSDEQICESIYGELKALSELIKQTKTDIFSTDTGDIKNKHIPMATDELGEVVKATAEATGTIMDACEAIEGAVDTAPDATKDEVVNQVTRIYEACSFQDITGQRISKVVNALKTIEEKISTMLGAIDVQLGHHAPSAPEAADEPAAPLTDKDLLNGPQMPGKGVTQDEIDRLLAEFDN